MQVIRNESTIWVDVDDTLVMWGIPVTTEHITVKCPHYGTENILLPHKAHIKILKDRKARGSAIIVWSASGFAWAEAVIKALQLEAYVDFVYSKAHAHIDDKTANEFMGERIYLPIDSKYGT